MNKIATLLTAAALIVGMSGSASAQSGAGLAGLGAGVTAGVAVGVAVLGLLVVTVVGEDDAVSTTTTAVTP